MLANKYVIRIVLAGYILSCYLQQQSRSMIDHVRQLYYKLRSGGIYGYASVNSSNVSSIQQFPSAAQSKVPAFLGAISVIVCFIAALVSLALSFSMVPRQTMPWTGLLVVYEWTFTLFFILFGSYLHAVHQWGGHVANHVASFSTRPESSDYDSGKGHLLKASSCDSAACYYGLAMASLALAIPLLPCLLGISALFVRLGVMVGLGIFLASFMTYASEHLSIRAFMRGFENRDAPRTRTFCYMC